MDHCNMDMKLHITEHKLINKFVRMRIIFFNLTNMETTWKFWLRLNTVYEFKVTAVIYVPFPTMKLWCILWVWRNEGIFDERVTQIFSRKYLFMVLNILEGLLLLDYIKRIYSLATNGCSFTQEVLVALLYLKIN